MNYYSSYVPLERKIKLIDWQGYIKAKLKESKLGKNEQNRRSYTVY